jgi:dipeptidyl-peptidase-4
VRSFSFSVDGTQLLIYTNSKRVWRYDTRGDYWVLNLKTNALTQLGKAQPESSLMFAKFSPDGEKVAYVSERNLYVETLSNGKVSQLTSSDSGSKLINGTFDWVYEEEFDCRDGFRWCPDSKRIAYWQIDANKIRDFFMINTTDSIYPFIVPVEYPKVGMTPSPYKIGVVDIGNKKTKWMNLPGDPQQTYLPRMEWTTNGLSLLAQQLNRKQNATTIFSCDAKTGEVSPIYQESDEAWIDLNGREMVDYFKWVDSGRSFLFTSEKDGWRHIYKISTNGKGEELLTKGSYDVAGVAEIDEDRGYVYFMASPDNATQSYLYRVRLDGSSSKPERVTPEGQPGTHSYNLSPRARYAQHRYSNAYTAPMREWVKFPDHECLEKGNSIADQLKKSKPEKGNVEFFQVTTEDGVTMDGWMVKPKDFDPTKKYPILYYVYTEPAGATVRDSYGAGRNRMFNGDMAEEGYIYASLDGRGTPALKGRDWRKAIYRKIGVVNIRDQAMGAKAMFAKYDFIDQDRVAVWGWSGGGSTTLNCLFQYPEIYQTGIAVAAVANQLTYDNIYQERYMGLPQENKEDFIQGSPVTHAKNLQGNLLYIHGTGDDNVHYQNAEMLVNELIKHNKYFQFMPYPNRSHGIWEGEGTTQHLSTMFTTFLRQHCPPGGKAKTP